MDDAITNSRVMGNDQYTVGWICALPFEMAAAQAMLDEEHGSHPSQDVHDHNTYFLGRIENHNVVIACLPGTPGLAPATAVAVQLLRSFTSIKFGLMVGVGGGVPTKKDDIRLGDVVVSQPQDRFGGVVQFDRGKRTTEGKFKRTGTLNKPPLALLSAVNSMKAKYERQDPQLGKLVDDILRKESKMSRSYSRPDQRDDLYSPDYNHIEHEGGQRQCANCDRSKVIKRLDRESPAEPHIFYGTIASGNEVVADSGSRDKLNKDLGGIMCFETEAAGLMDDFPCLVIRGICNYADSHKSDEWQKFAAATAAAYAKKLLQLIKTNDLQKTKTVRQTAAHQNPWLGPESPFSWQSASPSPEFWSSPRQPLGQLEMSRSPTLSPRSGQPSPNPGAMVGPQRVQAFPTNPMQLSPQQHESDNGNQVMMRSEGRYQQAFPMKQPGVGFRETGGYRQPSTMVYPRAPTMSHPPRSNRAISHDHSSAIPLRVLPGQQRGLRDFDTSSALHSTSHSDTAEFAGPTAKGASRTFGGNLGGNGHERAVILRDRSAGTDRHQGPIRGGKPAGNFKNGESKKEKFAKVKSKKHSPSKEGKHIRQEGNITELNAVWTLAGHASEADDQDGESVSERGHSSSDHDSDCDETYIEDEWQKTSGRASPDDGADTSSVDWQQANQGDGGESSEVPWQQSTVNPKFEMNEEREKEGDYHGADVRHGATDYRDSSRGLDEAQNHPASDTSWKGDDRELDGVDDDDDGCGCFSGCCDDNGNEENEAESDCCGCFDSCCGGGDEESNAENDQNGWCSVM